MRDEHALAFGSDAAEHHQRIGEGAQKGTQRQLVATVARKVAQQTGSHLSGGEDSAAMVIENTVPATPIVEEATAPSRVRAPVPPPL